MAYVKFAAAQDVSAESARAGESAIAESGGLGRNEWSVVDFARNDGLWSLNPDGFLQRLVRILFGIRPPRPLANDRLEALRRFAVIAWNKGAVGPGQVREFIAAGFSYGDAKQVLEHIARCRQLQSWPRGIA